MLLLVSFPLLLMIAPFGNVFGEGDDKGIVNYESFKMLRDFQENIFAPLIGFCPEKEFGVNIEKIDKKRPKWILCVPVNSMNKALINFGEGIRRMKLQNLKFKEDKRTIGDWFRSIPDIFKNKVKKHEREQSKWNKLKTLYQTLIDNFREAILLDMTKNYIPDYFSYIIDKGILGKLNIHKEETFKAMEKPDLKKLFISKVASLKEENETKKLVKIINEIRAIAMALNEHNDDIDEFKFLLQLFVANLSFCAKNLGDRKLQEIADEWPIWNEHTVDGTKN